MMEELKYAWMFVKGKKAELAVKAWSAVLHCRSFSLIAQGHLCEKRGLFEMPKPAGELLEKSWKKPQ